MNETDTETKPSNAPEPQGDNTQLKLTKVEAETDLVYPKWVHHIHPVYCLLVLIMLAMFATLGLWTANNYELYKNVQKTCGVVSIVILMFGLFGARMRYAVYVNHRQSSPKLFALNYRLYQASLSRILIIELTLHMILLSAFSLTYH